jgi:hypothetical protein
MFSHAAIYHQNGFISLVQLLGMELQQPKGTYAAEKDIKITHKYRVEDI